GLLEAVPEATIRALADPEDADGDGISGRVNEVWDFAAGGLHLGRFGWKANQPTVAQQVAAAAIGDLGLTTTLFPLQNCLQDQVECLGAQPGGDPASGLPEIDPIFFDRLVFYQQTLAVPLARGL